MIRHLAKYKSTPLVKYTLAALLLAAGSLGASAQLTFSGTPREVITESPESSTGLKAIYVLHDTEGVTATYTAASPSASVRWMRFSNLGGGYAEEIPAAKSGTGWTIALGHDDMGYIVEEDSRQQCFWVVNYQNHVCTLGSLDIASEQDCTTSTLLFQGSAPRIVYYSINGMGRTLSRGLTLEYNTLTFDEEKLTYVPQLVTSQLEYIGSEIHVNAPLCDTDFLLTGDRFQRTWGIGKSLLSPTLQTRAVDARTWAEQASRSVDNEQKANTGGESTALGGSAPVDITFTAAVTDAAIYREWQFTADPTFDIIDLRMADTEVTRTFTEYGTTYVRFLAGDDSGTCEYVSPTYTVNIGESKLDCPNAFSPGSSEGSNDEWKVSYKSIISFDCHIFNRWGIEVAHLTDPSQGWDGRYNGKLVKSGVFYYVIEAEGADGQHYKLSGDINILNANFNRNGGTGVQ